MAIFRKLLRIIRKDLVIIARKSESAKTKFLHMSLLLFSFSDCSPVEGCTGIRIRKVSDSWTLESRSLPSSPQEETKSDHVSQLHVKCAGPEQIEEGRAGK